MTKRRKLRFCSIVKQNLGLILKEAVRALVGLMLLVMLFVCWSFVYYFDEHDLDLLVLDFGMILKLRESLAYLWVGHLEEVHWKQ